MANSHCIALAGTTFAPESKFGPHTLAQMFGPSLPESLHPDAAGAVTVAEVAALLNVLGAEALAAFADDEIVQPGTATALTSFD